LGPGLVNIYGFSDYDSDSSGSSDSSGPPALEFVDEFTEGSVRPEGPQAVWTAASEARGATEPGTKTARCPLGRRLDIGLGILAVPTQRLVRVTVLEYVDDEIWVINARDADEVFPSENNGDAAHNDEADNEAGARMADNDRESINLGVIIVTMPSGLQFVEGSVMCYTDSD
jgi:hypothetical protein